ncbi:MAG: GtrA family protein [Oscillospiraceae bacterium]|nr:GtrA family protein [Oscillospiraceae bacterium]
MNRLILWFVRLMPKKIQSIYFKYEEIWLYLFYGALTTLVSMVTKLIPLYLANADAMGDFYTIYSGACATFSWICAVTFAFFTNRAYVFKSTANTRRAFWKEFINFYAGRLLSFFIDLGITMVFIGWLRWSEFWVTLAAQIIILIINYVISKLFVFRKTDDNTQTEKQG